MSGDKTRRIELRFRNQAENERMGRTMAAVFAAPLDPTLEELSDFKTAVSEAVTNAIVHAYPGREGEIRLELWSAGREVTARITDDGVGIADVHKSMEPLYTTAGREEHSGMGFTFMEAFSDRLDVESAAGKGTVVTLVKKMGGR